MVVGMVLVMAMEVGWWEKGGKVGGCGPGHADDQGRPQRRLKRLRDSADCSLHAASNSSNRDKQLHPEAPRQAKATKSALPGLTCEKECAKRLLAMIAGCQWIL